MFIKSRRDFLRAGLQSVTALGALGAMAKFGEVNALAAGPGYQALVCIFLSGGNDGHNTIIPIQTAAQNYGLYSGARQSLALPQASLLPITSKNGDVYGLHPKLSELQSLFNTRKAAVMANVGMLVNPNLDRTKYMNGAAVPANLFSHSDQTNQWQTSVPNGLIGAGWGGRLADFLQTQNSGAVYPPVVDATGCGIFCSGAQTLPTVVPPSGPIGIQGANNSPVRQQAIQQLLSFDNGLQLVQASNAIVTRGSTYANVLNGLITSAAPIQTPFPANNSLGAQLKMVARIMSVRSQLGLSRQIFFCTLGGFDTHGTQLATQDQLLALLSPAVKAFYTATTELGIDQQVTTFTSSEFGRTLMPNSSGGTDHAWGSHHFVVGGAVKGGDMYGTFPTLALGGQYDATGRGAMIPTSSVSQYASTMAEWFGVPSANLPTIFPGIGNFPVTNLGFV